MKISKILLEWYKKNARNLPWREDSRPYTTWLSEIIFQQTRIEQGLPYYHSFISAFPDISSLAAASEQEVLKLWQGLGYYSRARNLLDTARKIQSEMNGNFPETYRELLKLKGIGPYTAAAIASISFNEAVAAVDGNVIRVISRLFAIGLPVDGTEGRKLVDELANKLIDREHPGDFNEAMMDLGAMICTPRNPDCEHCPLNSSCKALEEGNPLPYPLKQNKVQVRERWLSYFLIKSQHRILIRERTGKDIWKGLYEFPLFETGAEPDEGEILKKIGELVGDAEITLEKISEPVRHQLSHQVLNIRFIMLTVNHKVGIEIEGYRSVSYEDLDNYPLPVVIANYIDKVWKK